MCIQVWDCDCHLEDPPEEDEIAGQAFVRPVRFGTRRQSTGGYYVTVPCGTCGVYGHPCKCEESHD